MSRAVSSGKNGAKLYSCSRSNDVPNQIAALDKKTRDTCEARPSFSAPRLRRTDTYTRRGLLVSTRLHEDALCLRVLDESLQLGNRPFNMTVLVVVTRLLLRNVLVSPRDLRHLQVET